MQSTAASAAVTLEEKIKSRTARVGIMGLGYVGLPLAMEFAKAGFPVTGIDIEQSKVAQLNPRRVLRAGCRPGCTWVHD